MKKFFTIAIILVAAFSTAKVHAQGFKIGLGAEGALPLGNLKNLYNFGAGATIRASFGIDESSAVTLTSGAIAFIPKDLNSGIDLKAQLNIPIKGGFKYNLAGPMYAIAEAGVTIVKSYYPDASGNLQSTTGSSFTYAPGIGVNLGGFDASVRYEGYSGAGFAALRLGFSF